MDALNHIKHTGVVIGCFLAIILIGCAQIDSQADAEAEFARDISSWMQLHDALTPSTPITNLIQLFMLVKHGYPYYHHRELARFGKHAGFTNSLAEKYIFFWPGFTNKNLQGEVLCMSAQPFPWPEDGLSRIYIAEYDGKYIYRQLSEERVRTVLRATQSSVVPLPTNHLMPPFPPEVQEWWTPTVADQYERFVWRLSGALNQDSSTPVRLGLKVLAGLVLISLGLLWLIFSRKRLKRSVS